MYVAAIIQRWSIWCIRRAASVNFVQNLKIRVVLSHWTNGHKKIYKPWKRWMDAIDTDSTGLLKILTGARGQLIVRIGSDALRRPGSEMDCRTVESKLFEPPDKAMQFLSGDQWNIWYFTFLVYSLFGFFLQYNTHNISLLPTKAIAVFWNLFQLPPKFHHHYSARCVSKAPQLAEIPEYWIPIDGRDDFPIFKSSPYPNVTVAVECLRNTQQLQFHFSHKQKRS